MPRCPCVCFCLPPTYFQFPYIPPPDAFPVPSHTSGTGPLSTWHPLFATDNHSDTRETLSSSGTPRLEMPHSSTILGEHNLPCTLAHTKFQCSGERGADRLNSPSSNHKKLCFGSFQLAEQGSSLYGCLCLGISS